MSESFWEPQAAVETADTAESVGPARNEPAEPLALAVSADEFAALEQRIHRAVEIVKQERQARAAAESRAAELEARVARAESLSLLVEQMEGELKGLRAERDQVRQRVERLLQQLDALEL